MSKTNCTEALLYKQFLIVSGLNSPAPLDSAGILRNKLILTGIVIQIVFSWAVLYFPPMQKILSTAPVAKEIHFLAGFGILLIFGMDYLLEWSICGKKITVRIFQSRDAMHRVSTGINV